MVEGWLLVAHQYGTNYARSVNCTIRGEEDLAVDLLTRLIAHDVLPVPSKSAGLRGTWRKLRDRREPLLTLIAGGWRGGCAALAETG